MIVGPGDGYRAVRALAEDLDRSRPEIDPDAADKTLTPASVPVLAAAEKALSGLEAWAEPEIDGALRTALVEELGLKPKAAFAPVRVAVTGRLVSPPLFGSIELLGRDRTLRRLAQALAIASAKD